MQIQVFKCANIYCQNPLAGPPGTASSKDRFCLACRKKTSRIACRCANPRCSNTFTGKTLRQIFCSEQCKWSANLLKRRGYFRNYNEARKILRKLDRIAKKRCKRCHGKLTQPYRRDYCSAYCHWLNHLLKKRKMEAIP
jgi:hypothetical protein